MTGNGAVMVSSGDDQKDVVPPWLRQIASIKLYSTCETHLSEKCNFYCRVCMAALCKECKKPHDVFKHEMIQAYKVARGVSFKMEDLKSLLNISNICPYTFNKCLVVYVYQRGDRITHSHGQSGVAECESCKYQLWSPDAKFCSVECKVMIEHTFAIELGFDPPVSCISFECSTTWINVL